MFGKKKQKKKKEPDYSNQTVLPGNLVEHIQARNGLTLEEQIKLLESLSRINPSITVTRQKLVKGKKFPKAVGKIPIDEAVEYTKKRAEARNEKNQKIEEMTGLQLHDVLDRVELNDEVYPKRLTPTDMARYLHAGKEQLEALDREREKSVKVFSPREEAVLDAITVIKKLETSRVAQRIAERQRAAVVGKTLEELESEHAEWLRKLKGEPEPETPEQIEERLKNEEEQKMAEETAAAEEAERMLEGFGKDIHTLVDEAGTLVTENPDAAAAVLKQWIGNVVVNSE
ncbi:MAG: hypothetical protein LBF88_01615 [Planctomycetaceae bacterium]|nr:hypothetical protein [Planctomycetaceae bacterium]